MNLYQKVLGVAFVLAVVGAGGYFILQNNSQPAALTDNPELSQGQPVPGANTPELEVKIETAITHEVIYTDAGFAPSTLNIKIGDTVTFKNQGASGMWVASAMHPTHMTYDGTSLQNHCPDTDNSDFDQCQANSNGASWPFTFNKIGSWGYHNHMDARHFGKIVVE